MKRFVIVLLFIHSFLHAADDMHWAISLGIGPGYEIIRDELHSPLIYQGAILPLEFTLTYKNDRFHFPWLVNYYGSQFKSPQYNISSATLKYNEFHTAVGAEYLFGGESLVIKCGAFIHIQVNNSELEIPNYPTASSVYSAFYATPQIAFSYPVSGNWNLELKAYSALWGYYIRPQWNSHWQNMEEIETYEDFVKSGYWQGPLDSQESAIRLESQYSWREGRYAFLAYQIDWQKMWNQNPIASITQQVYTGLALCF